MNEIELRHEMRKTALIMKGMSVLMSAYSYDHECAKHSRELEAAADMVMSWSCQKVEGREWP